MEERIAELNSVYKSLAAQRAPWETWCNNHLFCCVYTLKVF